MEEVREEIAELIQRNAGDISFGYEEISADTYHNQTILPLADQILSIEVTEGVTIKDLIKKGGEREMSEQMVIRLSDTEIRIVKSQCQYCKFWADRLGCNFYPLTPDFADNRPVDSCKVFEKELNHE